MVKLTWRWHVHVDSCSGVDQRRVGSDFHSIQQCGKERVLILAVSKLSTRLQESRVRIQSDAGVQQYGTLRSPYIPSVEGIEVLDVHVIKPNGTIVATPPDSIQDVPSELYRGVSENVDLREKHVPVKGLSRAIRWIIRFVGVWRGPPVPGRFWFSYQFLKSTVVLDEQLEISVPRD